MAGAEIQAVRYARACRSKLGAKVEVWGLGAAGDLLPHLEAAGLPWRAITATPEEPYPFVTALAEARPDVLLAFDWQANLLGARHWRHCGAGIFVWNQRDAGGFGPVAPLRGAAALTPCFLSNSVHACEYLIDSLGVSRDRIAIVKNEVTLPPPERSRESIRRQYRLEGRVVAIMVANIHGRKDHATLVKAWARVKAAWQGGLPPALLLVGRVDSVKIPQLVRSLGLEDDVVFAGPQQDVSSYLHAADFAVYSSRSEGLPSGVLEARAVGLTVVGTDIPGIREAVGPKGYAFLAYPGNVEGLAEKALEAALRKTGHYPLKQTDGSCFQAGGSPVNAADYAEFLASALHSKAV